MMKKRLSKTLWYGSDTDKGGKPVLPPLAEEANDLEGIHEGELYLHLGDGSALLFTRSADGQVVQLGSNADELANYLLKSVWDKVFEIRTTENGEEYLFTKLNFATQYGITMYANGGLLDLPSIFEGIPVDNDTIYWEETKGEEGNVITRVLKSRGVGEGGVTPTLLGDLKNVGSWANGVATEDRIMVQKKDSSYWEALELSKVGGSADFSNVKEGGEGNAFTSFVLSEDKKTLTFVKGKNFAEKSETLSGYGIKDAYTKTEADSLLEKKWTQDNNKIANWDTSYGWGDHSKAGYASKSTTLAGYGITNAYTKTETVNLLDDKADWGTTLEDYGITNAYTSEEVDELLGNYLPLSGGIITGDLRLRKGDEYTSPYLYFGDRDEVWLKEVNDTHLTIHADGTVIIDADLIVKGGITMYANEGDYTPSTIMDAVSVDNQTIIKQNGKLMVNPELVFGGGGEVSSIAWGNIIGIPSWITDTKPEYKYSEIKETPNLDEYAKKGTTISAYGIVDAKIANGVITLGGNSITPLTSHQTIYNLTLQAGTFSAATFDPNGGAKTVNIPTTTSHISEGSNLFFTDARAVSALKDTLKGYVTLSDSQTISGEKDFTGGLKVNGSPIVYNATRKYWKFEGDLLVTGGITMFGSDSSFSPSTITQAVNIDGSTLVRKNGVIMLNPDIQLGGGTDIDLSEYAKKATTLSGYGITDAYTKTESDGRYIKIGGSLSSNINFDNYYTPACYNNHTGDGSGSTNAPSTYGLMFVFGGDDLAAQMHLNAGNSELKTRTRYVRSGAISWTDWKTLAYQDGNIATATKLKTPRSIWGNNFDGSADIKNSSLLLYKNESSYTGGWSREVESRSSSGKVIGAFGLYGIGDTFGYAYIGESYGNVWLSVTPTSTHVYGKLETSQNVEVGTTLSINGITLKKSASGVLYVDGNLVVKGGVTMYGTDGTNANTIWDSAPIASTSVKGIASFDSNYFAVNNGKVTFVGQTGGGVADSVAWGNVTGKPTWLGSSKPSYTTSEVAEGTNLYFTNARAVSALSSTLSNYLPLSGGTLTDKLIGTTIVANDLYWREYKNKKLSSGGWYRFATSTRPDSYGNTYILSICRVYHSTSNESYLIAVTLDYSGCSFTQLAGHRYSTAAQLVTKIRCTRTHSGDVYFDFYYTGSSQNTVYVNAIGHCKVQTPEATSSTLTYTDEFILEEGVKSSLGFIGDLKGNADTATSATTATTASKLSTVSKTAWGQTYWTSGGIPTNISGNMSSVGSITPSTHNTYSIGSYGNGFAWSNFNCISSGAVSNNLWLCGGTTSGIGVVIARSNSNTTTGELCRFTEQGMVWASGVRPAIVSTAQDIHLKYNNADATSIMFNGASFKPFISASDNIMLGRYDSLWRGLFLSTDASVPRTEKGVTFCSSNGYAEGKIGANSSGIGIYTVGGLYLRGGCTKGANGTMTESSTGAVIDASGNMLVTGGITMYSDLRKKTILNHVELSLKEVADAPLIEHYYNSDESKRTHVGSIAQYWAELNDWFCKEDEEGFLTMEIQNAALASAISVARELTRYESKTDKQIKKLKKRIGELEEKIENLKKM